VGLSPIDSFSSRSLFEGSSSCSSGNPLFEILNVVGPFSVPVRLQNTKIEEVWNSHKRTNVVPKTEASINVKIDCIQLRQ
jgi:hypothetical protein